MSYPPPPPGAPGPPDPTQPEPGLPPTYRPGTAPLPPPYDPTTPFPAYGAPPPAGGSGGGSTVLLWVLIGVFAVLLCAGAGVAGVLAYRDGADDERASADRTTEPAAPQNPLPLPTGPPDDPTDEPGAPSSPGGGVVTYEVTGDGPASITYLKGATLGNEAEGSAALPWRAEVKVDEPTFLVSLIALRKQSEDGSITCRVLFNGEEVVRNTAEGPFATVACFDLVFD